MNASHLSKVDTVNNDLQANHVQTTLEKAGIQVTIARSASGLDVLVPGACAAAARELLHPQLRSEPHASPLFRPAWAPI